MIFFAHRCCSYRSKILKFGFVKEDNVEEPNKACESSELENQ